MGVWIEIVTPLRFIVKSRVTPFMGVWIEIVTTGKKAIKQEVTPFMGVWIEITVVVSISNVIGCHTLYGCVD